MRLWIRRSEWIAILRLNDETTLAGDGSQSDISNLIKIMTAINFPYCSGADIRNQSVLNNITGRINKLCELVREMTNRTRCGCWCLLIARSNHVRRMNRDRRVQFMSNIPQWDVDYLLGNGFFGHDFGPSVGSESSVVVLMALKWASSGRTDGILSGGETPQSWQSTVGGGRRLCQTGALLTGKAPPHRFHYDQPEGSEFIEWLSGDPQGVLRDFQEASQDPTRRFNVEFNQNSNDC